MWALLKPLINANIASKIFFVNSVLDFIDVQETPKSFGGQDEMKYTYIPIEDNPNVKLPDRNELDQKRDQLLQSFFEVTREEMKTEDRLEKSEKREQLHHQMVQEWHKLEPYRARTIYHRLKVIDEQGQISWDHLTSTS